MQSKILAQNVRRDRHLQGYRKLKYPRLKSNDLTHAIIKILEGEERRERTGQEKYLRQEIQEFPQINDDIKSQMHKVQVG